LTVAKRKKDPPETGTVVHLHTGNSGSGDAQHADDDEIAEIDAMEDGALSRAIEEVRNTEGASAEVHRIMPPDRAGFCRRYAMSVFSQERIAADYGAGKYRVKFKGPGDKYIRGGGTISIAEGLNTAPPTAATGMTDVLALFKAERDRDKEERAKADERWFKWATLLVPVLGPKLVELIGGGSKGPSIRDLVATMKDMKDLQAPATNLTTQFSEVMNILQGAKDLVGDDGGGKTGSTWVDLLRDVMNGPAMGAIASAIPGLASAPRLSLPGSPVAPVSAAPPAPAGNSESAPATAASCSPQKADMLEQLNWLRLTLAQMLIQAQKQGNPRLYAEVVLDNLPPFITPQDLLKRLSAESWWTQLQQVDQRLAAHEAWFVRFRNVAVKLLRRRTEATAPGAPAEAPAPQAGPGFNQPMTEGEGGEFE
jgi:hypothetical protein